MEAGELRPMSDEEASLLRARLLELRAAGATSARTAYEQLSQDEAFSRGEPFWTYIMSQLKDKSRSNLCRVFRAAHAAPREVGAQKGGRALQEYCTSVTRKRVMDWRWPIFLR